MIRTLQCHWSGENTESACGIRVEYFNQPGVGNTPMQPCKYKPICPIATIFEQLESVENT